MHETQNRVNVSLVDATAPQLFIFYVVHAVHATTERPVALELDAEEGGEFAVLKAPEILAVLAFTRGEAPPELRTDEGA